MGYGVACYGLRSGRRPFVDNLKAMIAGELPLPPIAALMQFERVDAEPGKVVFTCRPDGSVYNPNGGVYGGLVCALLDSVARPPRYSGGFPLL